MPKYGKWVWEEFDFYEASPGDTWDDLATLAYADPMACSLLLHENPGYCDRIILSGGEILSMPVIDETKSDVVPPWRK